jgi:hypothetical protein
MSPLVAIQAGTMNAQNYLAGKIKLLSSSLATPPM